MHSAGKPAPRRRTAKRKTKMNHYGKTVIRWLIFCFPAGLLMMWSDRCRWSRGVKSAVSLSFCLLVTAVLLPQTLPPERPKGGVEIVSSAPVVGVYGPQQQGGDEYERFVPDYIKPVSLLAEPTPAPDPVYVFCNDGGRYYHTERCRYKKKTSTRTTLTRALEIGYERCTKCNAPRLEDF